MKLFDDNMQAGQAGNFGFSGVRPEKLGSTEYTLVTYVGDKTGSVRHYAQLLLDCKKAVIGACRKSPRAEFLLVRNTEFNTEVDEVHGFVELATLDESQYALPKCSGHTALFDATYAAIAATNEYAKTLSDQDFSVNGIIFVITDGVDDSSVQTFASIKAELTRGIENESLESLMVVLIGVNASMFKRQLDEFKVGAELTQYIDAGEATPQKLAQLADFVSRSISSQSGALGTGGPSVPLVF